MATILIVDDSPDIRKHFATPLRKQGHRLLEAADGVDALKLARKERPHLIMADTRVAMPGGYEIVRQLRSELEMAQTRVILYSGRDIQQDAIELAHAIDVPLVLPKPSNPEEFIRLVELVLSRTKGSADPASGLRRNDRQLPRRSLQNPSRGATDLERMKSEIAHLQAEVRCRDEQRVRTNESILAEAEQLSHIGSWNWNIESGTVAWSDEHYRIFGLSPQEIVMTYDDVLSFVHPDDLATLRSIVEQALRVNQPFEYCLRALHRNGTTRYVQSRGRVVLDEGGKPARMFGTVQDVTERIHADRRLRESEEQFRQLAEHIGEVFWMVDPRQSQVIYVSPAFERIWGRTRESLYESPQSWLEAIHPADRERVVEAVGKMLAEARYGETYRIVQPNGSIRWIRDQGFPVYDAAGSLVRMAGLAADITDLKQGEEELRRYVQRLEVVSEIDHAILAARSSQEIAQAAVSRIRRLVPCQRASLVTFDFEAGLAVFLAVSTNGESRQPPETCIPIDAFCDMRDLLRGQARMVEDPQALQDQPSAAKAALEEGVQSYLMIPIRSKDELLGLFKLEHEQSAAFNREHVEIVCEIADRVAISLKSARLYEQVLSGQERMRALSAQLLMAHEDERRRISRELHDEIGQALTVTKVSLEALKKTAGELASAAERTMSTVANAVQQVRNLSLDLRPPMLDDLGLVAALRSYLDRQAQDADFSVHFEIDSITSEVSTEIETACFRVAQEAMTNIIRHARPRQVRVELRQCEGTLRLLVHDDGIGFDVAAARQRAVRGECLGLLGMEERVTLLGGQIDVKSTPGHGTEILACFPIHPATRFHHRH